MSNIKSLQKIILWLFVTTLILPLCAFAGDVKLAWDANTESDLAGYKVYYGTGPRNYSGHTVIGKQTTHTVTGLQPGIWYFAVSALSSAGSESGFSNEVSTTVSGSSSTCDINADGSINALDLQVLINVILGSHSCPGSCDINRDGRVDVLDLQILGNVILGLRSCP